MKWRVIHFKMPLWIKKRLFIVCLKDMWLTELFFVLTKGEIKIVFAKHNDNLRTKCSSFPFNSKFNLIISRLSWQTYIVAVIPITLYEKRKIVLFFYCLRQFKKHILLVYTPHKLYFKNFFAQSEIKCDIFLGGNQLMELRWLRKK